MGWRIARLAAFLPGCGYLLYDMAIGKLDVLDWGIVIGLIVYAAISIWYLDEENE